MNKLKVMTIVGTRPEIIKLSQVMKELDRHVEHIIVHTGQNYDYELNELFFEQLDIRKPDIFLEAVKGSPSETIGDIIAKADKVFAQIRPDALLIYGDTNSCLSVIPVPIEIYLHTSPISPIFVALLIPPRVSKACGAMHIYHNILEMFFSG